MKIEQFVSNMAAGAAAMDASREKQLTSEAGGIENLRASMNLRRQRDELSSLIARHPDLVARLLVRAWETAEVVADPLGSDTRLGNTLLALGAEVSE